MNTPLVESLPGILNVTFEGVNGESLLMALDLLSVSVSTGSACSTGARKLSHVLAAMGRSPREVRSSIRFSAGRSNDTSQIEVVIECLATAVGKLRQLAPRS